MREDWEVRSFEKCVIKITPPKKVKSTEYHVNGLYPIISQDNHIISGYWDNINDIVNINKPVVIFGDHTRVVKYVDYNFVVGADGVIILQPIQELTSKYFYYYLKSSYIPNLGYSRHYKLLKNLEIPIPPLQTQHQIVEELDCLTSIIEKQKKQLEELDNLAQAIFYDMFGDPIENEKGWKVFRFCELFSLKSGNSLSANKQIPGIFNVYGGNGITGTHIEFNRKGEYIIIGRVGAYCGNVRIVNGSFWLTDNAFELIQKTEKQNSKYLLYLLRLIDLFKYANHAAQPVISNTVLQNVIIPLPPLPLQQQFASKIEAIEKQKELIKKSIKETEDLFNSRMDYYFN